MPQATTDPCHIDTYQDVAKKLRWRIVHPQNGEVVHASMVGYGSMDALIDDLRDLQAEYAFDTKKAHIYNDTQGFWRWRIQGAAHDQTLDHSHESYADKRDCVANVELCTNWLGSRPLHIVQGGEVFATLPLISAT